MHLLFAMLLAATQQWIVVSDLHLDPFAYASRPVRYEHDTNWALFDVTLAQMRRAAPQARVVVIDGDFLAHHFDSKVHAAYPKLSVSSAAVSAMARIEHAFAQAFPRAQFLIALGNNDDPCGDYATAPHSQYLAQLARIWSPLVNRDGSSPHFIRDFSRNASYTVRIPESSLRAIVLDDVYWSVFYRPCGRDTGQSAAQMNALSAALRSTPTGQRAAVVMHIPPGVDPTSTLYAHRFLVVPFLRANMAAGFARIVQTNAQRIAFGILGHMHRADFRLVSGAAFVVTPSVSPIYKNNPAFLTLDVGADGTLRDYRMYAYDVETDTWLPPLDFDRTYGVTTITSQSLANVHDRIADDPTVRERWANGLVGFSDEYDARRVWQAFWCAQTELRSGYAACAGDRRRVAALPVLLALLALVVVLAPTAFFMRRARQRRGA